MLHDVGKVAIPNEILFKPGALDADEWAIMREHPVIGERILRRTPELEPIAPMVRHEHERWDGGGYPDGLAGEDIPIGSRIILACDAYNAMITQRPYREPMSSEEADRRAARRTPARSSIPPWSRRCSPCWPIGCPPRRLRAHRASRSTPSPRPTSPTCCR